jgi:hypothetical protein
MKLYELVKTMLIERPELRDSDKKLIWAVFMKVGAANETSMTYYDFTDPKCPSTESIRRCRQKIQENHPDLKGSIKVQQLREGIEAQRGTHIYREELPIGPFVAMGQSIDKFGKDWEDLRAKLHSSKYKKVQVVD